MYVADEIDVIFNTRLVSFVGERPVQRAEGGLQCGGVGSHW